MANTNFRSSGTDLANLSAFSNLLSKEYVFDTYPDVIPFFRKAGLWVWGNNGNGQLGLNDTTTRSVVSQYTGDAVEWKSLSGGWNHSAGIKTDGTLWLWGNNGNGQLGDDSTTNRSSPVQTVSTGTNWLQVSGGGGGGGAHTAAIKTDGTLWCWGLNSSGQLGDNSTTNRSSPVQTVDTGTTWSSVDCGEDHTAAVKTDGTLWLWGGNGNGQLGDNTGGFGTSKSSPIQTVSGGTNWKQVSAGKTFTAAIKTDGTLWLWGLNFSGQLGDDTGGFSAYKSSPVQTVAGGSNWKFVKCSLGQSLSSSGHVVALKTDGSLWLWGNNQNGQLGDNTSGFSAMKSSPVQTVAGGTSWKKVSCSGAHTVAVKSDSTVWTWGGNNNGELGNNVAFTNKSSPVQTYPAGIGWKDVAGGGGGHNLAIRDNSEDPL